MCYDPRKLDNKNYIYVLCLCSIKELMTLILVSLEHWNPWFVLETTGEAHQLFFLPYWLSVFDFPSPSCGCSPHLASCAICVTHLPFPVLRFAKCDNLLHHPTILFPPTLWWPSLPKLQISCCNLSELSIKSPLSRCLPVFLSTPTPSPCPPVLLTSDNHPGSAPILQLAASSFQNPGAPPHETKSKFHWSSRDDSQL